VSRLIERADSLLLVVDAQPGFYGESPAAFESTRGSLDRVAWLAAVATALEVPAVLTEEDPARNGPTDPAIRAALPATVPTFDKVVFGAADQVDIREAIESTGRRTVVVAGLETDVCVAHSALGLLDREYRVVVVTDATYAPDAAHDAGLRRMAAHGVELAHAKGVYYEWIRTLGAARAFQRHHPDLAEPPGFSL
jgi:nicotinamidase-related amidase